MIICINHPSCILIQISVLRSVSGDNLMLHGVTVRHLISQ